MQGKVVFARLLIESAGWGGREVWCMQGVTRRCRLSWLISSVLESKCGEIGGLWGLSSVNEYCCALHITCNGAQINFGDLTPYLTYGCMPPLRQTAKRYMAMKELGDQCRVVFARLLIESVRKSGVGGREVGCMQGVTKDVVYLG